MTFYTGSERVRQFDAVIEAGLSVLKHPDFVEALDGSLLGAGMAERMASRLEGAFIPNMDGDAIAVPREYRDSDRLMIVPLLPHDVAEGRLSFDPSAFAIGSVREREAHDTMRQIYEATEEDIASFIACANATLTEFPYDIDPYDVPDSAWTYSRHVSWKDGRYTVQIHSKPFVAIRIAEDTTGIPPQPFMVASMLGHEIAHVLGEDNMLSVHYSEDVDDLPAYAEGMSYYASRIIADTAPTPALTYNPQAVYAAEACREQYAQPEDPFPLSPEYTAAMNEQRLLHGFAEAVE
ncbi:MAG TPA: hypothetical protein VJP80_04730 [Candidatus Saccharimonadales bacterium]|nr:hypothetical protein [Candidatus Saccharimonadales bacterium]